MSRNLAIIGASYLQLPLIEKAKELGYTTHVFAWEAHDVGEAAADYFYPISIVKRDEILHKCREIGICGICTIASDLGIITSNYVANKLGLTANGWDATLKSTDKRLMRQALEAGGDPCPRSLYVDHEDILPDISGMRYPLIVKPTDRSGSRGVYKLERKNESLLKQVIRKAMTASLSKSALVEEYAPGTEYSVEYISWKGAHHFLQITMKYTTGAPRFIETGHLEPAPVSADTLTRVKRTVEHALDSLGLQYGASHSELKIDDSGNIQIIEIAGRMGGDCIGSDLVRYSTGYDFVKMVIQVACGVEPDFTKVCQPQPVESVFIMDGDDLAEYRQLLKLHPERILKTAALHPENLGRITDSSNRGGCYIRTYEAPPMKEKGISFNVPPSSDDEIYFVSKAIESGRICGNGVYTKKCETWMQDRFHANKVLLTTSGTAALDMALLLCKLHPGDEVIVPSFTFSSSANAIILAGGTPVFVDIRPDTMNLDENKLEPAITAKTRAIVVVHYAGVACEMDTIMDIARRHGLKVIEDAAQGVMSRYKERYLGTIGDFGCYSFHETKNYSMGEGGALVINDPDYNEQAEILWEKGTNRSKFLRGQIDKYTWVDFGDSFLPSEMNAAFLWPQLLRADEILCDRLETWNAYYKAFQDLKDRVELPVVPEECAHNGHIFYLKLRDIKERTDFIAYLKSHNIQAVFHYVPLHSAPAGRKYGRLAGRDECTTTESERLVRLPMYYGLTEADRGTVVDFTHSFFAQREGAI